MNIKDAGVQKYSDSLKKLGIAHDIVEHPELKTPPETLGYFGLTLADGVSTMIMRAGDEFVAVLRRDDLRLDFAKIKKILGVIDLRIAKPAEFVEVTGMPLGAARVYNPGLKTFLDKRLFEKEILMGGTGSFACSFRYKTSDLKKIPGSKVVDILEEAKVVVKNKRFLSGITPSGDGSLHIGNYLGAVRQFIELARTNETYLMVADLHGLTTVQDKKQLQHNIETLVLNELALLKGFLSKEEFEKIVFFRQSDVPLHTEGQSILNNVTPLGLLKRAHAYKDKLQKDVMEDDINVGLFSYPMLMASDILLYQPDFVPVGKDQKQHIEITRDIAERFNKIYKENVFKLPDPFIPEEVAAVLGTDGKRKMSKSLGNVISMFESEEVIRKQVNGTFTDPTRKHATDKGHIEGNMVFVYLDFFGDAKKVTELKDKYTSGNVGDVEVKEYLFDSLITFFAPARNAYEELKANPKLVKEILQRGQAGAMAVATKTMESARDAMGITTQYSFFRYQKPTGSLDKLGMTISIEDFARMEVRVGKVIEARNKEGSEKLIRLVVDIGEEDSRIIFTGVRGFGYVPEDFLGKQFFFITNLAYRKMLDEESQGMILAVDGQDKKPQFIPAEGMTVGAKIR